MKCLISITKLPNKILKYFILLFVIKIVIFFIRKEIHNLNENHKLHFFTYFIFMYLGECLSIFYFIYRYNMTKKKKNEKDEIIESDDENSENKTVEKKDEISFIFYLNTNKYNYNNFSSFFPFNSKEYKNIFIIFSISLCDFIASKFLYKYSFDFYGVSGITGLLLFKFLFKYQIYNHHILSIIILVISSLFQINISIFLAQTNSEDEINPALKTFFEIIFNICNGFFLILTKYLIDIKHIESLIVLFLQGIFGLIITILYYLLFKFNEFISNWKEFFSLNLEYYLFIFFFLICVSVYNISIVLLVENSPSIYCLFIYTMAVYFSNFIKIDIKKFLKGFLVITFILNIIDIFAMLIFVEFFVLNFCGLNYNCRVSIQKRELEEKKIYENEEDMENNMLFQEDNKY